MPARIESIDGMPRLVLPRGPILPRLQHRELRPVRMVLATPSAADADGLAPADYRGAYHRSAPFWLPHDGGVVDAFSHGAEVWCRDGQL